MNRKEFLDSKEGTKWFRERTKEMSKASRSQFKKWLISPRVSLMQLKREKWYGDIDDAIERLKNEE